MGAFSDLLKDGSLDGNRNERDFGAKRRHRNSGASAAAEQRCKYSQEGALARRDEEVLSKDELANAQQGGTAPRMEVGETDPCMTVGW
jgi:hypothetical protein